MSAAELVNQFADRISQMSDDILLHILSFLPTPTAIRTSVLAKRWSLLWVSLPHFSLTDPSFDDNRDNIVQVRKSFLDSIQGLFSLRAGSCITRFHLALNSPVDESSLISWLRSTINHRVQELSLVLPVADQITASLATIKFRTLVGLEFPFPNCTFAFEPLSSMILRGGILRAPSASIQFSNLRVLELRGVTFRDEQSIHELFSGCMVLEELTISTCGWMNAEYVTLDIPSLTMLCFENCCGDWICDYPYYSLIKLRAKNLKHLACRTDIFVLPLMCETPSLEFVFLDVVCRSYCRIAECMKTMQMLQSIHNVKSLTLTNRVLEAMRLIYPRPRSLNCPKYYNLTHLDISLGSQSFGTPICQEWFKFLKYCPNLESLGFLNVKGFKAADNNLFLESLPFWISGLKSFSFKCFDGDIEDWFVLNNICVSAPVLEMVTLYCRYSLIEDLHRQEEIKDQLNQLRTNNSSLVIEFLLNELA